MATDGNSLYDLASTTSALQAGIIGLIGYLGRSTFRLADRLARIEMQVEESKERLKQIDERCWRAIQTLHRKGEED